MSPDMIFAIGAVFVAVGVISCALASFALSWNAPGRKRLRGLSHTPSSGILLDGQKIAETVSPAIQRLASVIPKSPKDMTQLQRRLASAGMRSFTAAVVFSTVKLALPVVCVLAALQLLGLKQGWIAAAIAGVAATLLPDFWLARKIKLRQKAIRNGLPDALDLFIVCLEAGSSLDQAMLKASEELAIAHPALAEELRLVITETRAGKPRLDALKNFSERTKVDDVRALVAMLIQTDRFGTSVAQALRTHAETSRTKRRQRAEERAAKLGVKMVFPLVFCLFPALYVVILGAAFIKIYRVLYGGIGGLVR